MKKFPWKSLLICSSLLSQHISAEEVSIDQLYIAPALGYYVFDSERDLDETTFGSIAAGLMINPVWALELSYTQFETDHKYNTAIKDFDFEQYHLDGLYHLELNRQCAPECPVRQQLS